MTVIANRLVKRSLPIEETNLIAAAGSLIPTLRLRRSETDTLARLPESTVADLDNERLFSMLVPKLYGGLQSSLQTFMDVVVELGRGDGSVAWVVALLSSSTWMAATLYPKNVVDEVFSSRECRIAGVLSPRKVNAKRVDGGFLIEEGFWEFNSGAHHAQWEILGIPIRDESGRVIDRGAVLVPQSLVTIIDDWDTIGLRGSGSNSVTAKDIYVPNERVALFSKALRQDYASMHLRDETLYRMPLMPLLKTNLAFAILGMAKATVELFIDGASQRVSSCTEYGKRDEAAITHLQVGKATAKIDAAELILRRSVHDLEATAVSNLQMTREVRARIWRDAGAVNQLLWEAVDLLSGASGSSFARVGNSMNRLWHDVRVAGLHGGIQASTSAEIFGRVSLGKDPDTPML